MDNRDGVRLVSAASLRGCVSTNTPQGPPAVWLHPDGSTTAWIIVDINVQAWSQLAYSFGYEFGHVMANRHSKPLAPGQWLEEAIVEAFTARGLGQLAQK